MSVSIVMPVLNEAENIVATLTALQVYRRQGHDVIVIDGGSRDDSVALARPLADVVLSTAPGRARQMNRGASVARGDVLLFLHADTQLPAAACDAIAAGLKAGAVWGRFDVRLSGSAPGLRVIEYMMNLRSRLTKIATGDQAMFVAREVFFRAGGFNDMPLMEDIALSRRLKRVGPCACLRQRVTTSSRRWEQAGLARTVGLMWWLRLSYWLGADPARLVRQYYR